MRSVNQLYRLHDNKEKQQEGAIPIEPGDAEKYNKTGYGIFWSYNEFDGPRRIDTLKRIHSWAIDLDSDSKEKQLLLIKHGLVPSAVIESRRGYHVYFDAKNAQFKHWYSIVQDRLIPYYNADRRAKDITRLLRAPGYNNMKDPTSPYFVDYAWKYDVKYSQEDIAYFYPDTSAPERTEFVQKQSTDLGGTTSFWEFVWRLDAADALLRLSGHKAVSGEVFTLRRNGNGNLNIIVDGKSTSCFIDKRGQIGSSDGGGPSLAQWLRWYGHPWSYVIATIKELFPEARDL